MADQLPGSQLTADQWKVLQEEAAGHLITWFAAFQKLVPTGTTPLAQWILDEVTQAFLDGRLTAGQVEQLTGSPPSPETVAPPVSLLTAWADLMQALAVTWPKRRKAAAAQLDRTNQAVRRAQRTFARG